MCFSKHALPRKKEVAFPWCVVLWRMPRVMSFLPIMTKKTHVTMSRKSCRGSSLQNGTPEFVQAAKTSVREYGIVTETSQQSLHCSDNDYKEHKQCNILVYETTTTYDLMLRPISRPMIRFQIFGLRLNVAIHEPQTWHAYIQPQIQKLDLKSDSWPQGQRTSDPWPSAK
jgi:hypothetical protein